MPEFEDFVLLKGTSKDGKSEMYMFFKLPRPNPENRLVQRRLEEFQLLFNPENPAEISWNHGRTRRDGAKRVDNNVRIWLSSAVSIYLSPLSDGDVPVLGVDENNKVDFHSTLSKKDRKEIEDVFILIRQRA